MTPAPLAAALLLAATLPLSLSAAPAGATGCFTYTDEVGDSQPDLLVDLPDSDPALDIVGVEYLTTPTAIGARIEVAALSATGPAKAPGDVFQFGFTHDGFYFDVYAERLAGNVVLGSSSPAGLSATATYDVATNSVTILTPRLDVEAVTGTSLANSRLGDLNAAASADYGTWIGYDEAWPAGGTTYLVGSSC